jgi:TolB-like protein/Flp pilus assembly protein TadD
LHRQNRKATLFSNRVKGFLVDLKKFFAELQRRNVYRAAVVYTMTSWLLIQVATQVFPFFAIPNWIVRLIIMLLVAGFPVAVVLAWAFEFTPHGLVKTDELPSGRSLDWPVVHRVYTAVIGILAIAIAVLLYLRFSPSQRATAEGIPAKSIAVLPFENYSAEKENAYFADGIQDDLLTNLAKIQDLTVISRTSVRKYRDAGNRDIREIGKTLGVANILEGSVRREKDRVVVNVQLIDARRDRHLWANRYDRTIQDSLGLEGELATEIADALRARLTPEEKERVVKKPTRNADAYLFYLRALPYEQGPDTLLQDYRKAVDLYAEAIKLDPDFALARAHLASTCAEIFHFYEPFDTWKSRARTEAETALRLQPDLGEAHFALGQCAYWFEDDYERALAEFAIAQKILPNDSNIGGFVAAIRRRQGRWEEALATYERMEKLDPQNPNILRNLVFTNTSMRRWPQAAQAAAQFRTVASDSVVAKVQSAYVQFMWKGDITALADSVAEIPAGNDPDGIVTVTRWESAMIQRDFAGAEAILAQSPRTKFSYLLGDLQPKTFLAGVTAVARGDRAAADQNFRLAAPLFERSVQEAADAAERHANLGLAYAFMGRGPDAIREGRLAVELKPESKDATDGAIMLCYLALIYARVGENDQAIPLIRQLLKTSGAVDSVDYSITLNDLRYRWEWDPLRSDPQFQKLIAAATPVAP